MKWRLAQGAYAAALRQPALDPRRVRPHGQAQAGQAPDPPEPPRRAPRAAPVPQPERPRLRSITLRVNGREQDVTCRPSETLAQVLQRRLGLFGTKVACDRGECGACTVLVDGKTVLSCMTLMATVADGQVETVEGLATTAHPGAVPESDQLSPLQSAFLRLDAYQCGYCTPGFLMAAEGLLRRAPRPSRAQVVAALSGNICRCGAYDHIIDAILQAAAARAASISRPPASADGEGHP